MKKVFETAIRNFMIACFSTVSLNAFCQCEEALKDFYVTYMNNVANCDDTGNEKLKEAHMSPELIARISEYTIRYGADAVIHSQDVCRYAIESLTVLPMQDNGYLVKYKWNADAEPTFFPVHAVCDEGKLRILDIFPVGTDSKGESYIKKSDSKE